jgi:Uma2 family endonuclease
MATAQTITTAQQLFEAGDIGPCELVRGELIMMSPAGFEHGDLGIIIASALSAFVRTHRLGKVCGADTGFYVERNPDTVRAPDVAFVRKERVHGRITAYFDGAPDLAVEIISPNDRRRDIEAKTQMWLDTGCEVVWVVDPPRQTITVYKTNDSPKQYQSSDTIECPDLLPGFALPLKDVFEDDV